MPLQVYIFLSLLFLFIDGNDLLQKSRYSLTSRQLVVEDLSITLLRKLISFFEKQITGLHIMETDSSEEEASPRVCVKCCKPIQTKLVLYALDNYWHEDCLKCSYCSKRLSDMANTFYFKQDMLLCRTDYIRLFGSKGCCSFCLKDIPPLESVMRARNHVFHLNCFACQACGYRFCVGDKFFLHQNSVLCEQDYEEMLIGNFNPHSMVYDNIHQ